MLCRHVIVINYSYYCSADLRSIWPAGCLQSRAASAESSSFCPASLGAKQPAAARAAGAQPALASWLGSQHAVPASPAASGSSAASKHCRLPAGKGGNAASIPSESSSLAGVSGKAGCKTGMSFHECFQAMDLALEVLQRALSSAWDAWECWGVFRWRFLEVGEDFGVFGGSPSSPLCCVFAFFEEK